MNLGKWRNDLIRMVEPVEPPERPCASEEEEARLALAWLVVWETDVADQGFRTGQWAAVLLAAAERGTCAETTARLLGCITSAMLRKDVLYGLRDDAEEMGWSEPEVAKEVATAAQEGIARAGEALHALFRGCSARGTAANELRLSGKCLGIAVAWRLLGAQVLRGQQPNCDAAVAGAARAISEAWDRAEALRQRGERGGEGELERWAAEWARGFGERGKLGELDETLLDNPPQQGAT